MDSATEINPPASAKKKPLVFLVDDQPALLALAEVSLQDCDCTLRKFLDPEAALAAFLRAKPKPVLLITDYAMGVLNGLDLIEQCKAVKPDLKTIMISGTAGAEIILDSAVKVDRFLGKPYQPPTLAELVRRVLAEVA